MSVLCSFCLISVELTQLMALQNSDKVQSFGSTGTHLFGLDLKSTALSSFINPGPFVHALNGLVCLCRFLIQIVYNTKEMNKEQEIIVENIRGKGRELVSISIQLYSRTRKQSDAKLIIENIHRFYSACFTQQAMKQQCQSFNM